MSTLENPFHPPLKGPGETNPAKDVELAKQLLGDADAALLASVQRGGHERTAPATPDSVMTDEERGMLAQVEAKECENVWDREGYIKWAQSIGRDKAWVDNTFVFDADSTIETWGDLDLSNIESLTSFPQNLTTVNGYLDLNNLTSANNLTFPRLVNDDLNLDNLTSADNVTLPQTVGGFLVLDNLTNAKSLTLPKWVDGDSYLPNLTSANNTIWPDHIGGRLRIPRAFTAQAEQLKASGVLKGGIGYSD